MFHHDHIHTLAWSKGHQCLRGGRRAFDLIFSQKSPEDIPTCSMTMDIHTYHGWGFLYIISNYIYICIYIYIQPEWNSTSSGYMRSIFFDMGATWTESLGTLEAPTTPSAFRESKASEFIWYNKLSSWMRHGPPSISMAGEIENSELVNSPNFDIYVMFIYLPSLASYVQLALGSCFLSSSLLDVTSEWEIYRADQHIKS